MKAKVNRKGWMEMMALSYGKLRDLAELTVAEAQTRSPYDTGNNRDSIKFRQGENANEQIVYTESGYGGWLEIGTAKMPARPYIAPGYRRAAELLK